MPAPESFSQVEGECCAVRGLIKAPRRFAERRKGIRRSVGGMGLEVVLLGIAGLPSLPIIATDLSTTGMGFHARRSFSPDEMLTIKMPVINGVGRLVLSRACTCRQVSRELYHVGVEFVEAVSVHTRVCCIPARWLIIKR